MSRQMIVHSGKCTGCRICELVCSLKKQKKFAPTLSRIRVASLYPEDGADRPRVCVQCTQALCSTCGRDAMRRDENTHTILIDEKKCNGCDKCTISCPLGAIRLLHDRPIVIVCDLCAGNPECVRHCPTAAIEYSNPNEMRLRLQRDSFPGCLEISFEKNPWRTGS